jgi:hypothetical protein
MSAMDGSSPEVLPKVTSKADHPTQKSFSCVLCAQRKVKCDRRPAGCANCTKARVPCIYKAPPPPRRRKKGDQDVDASTRLRLYEAALRQLGEDPEHIVKHALASSHGHSTSGTNDSHRCKASCIQREIHSTPTEVGILVTEEGKSRYLENSIWTSLQSEFRDTKEILEDSTDEESVDGTPDSTLGGHYVLNGTNLVFSGQTPSTELQFLHPSPIQIFKLWQTYLDNINPLVKVFHAPTVQQLISEASGHLDDVPRNVEALLFAIYCISIESLTDEDCLSILEQNKSTALRRFRFGAQCALTNANLLRSSDLMVLQAFVLFIVSIQRWAGKYISSVC